MAPSDPVLMGKRKPRREPLRSSEMLEVEDDEARETRLGNLLAEKASEDALRIASDKKNRGDRLNSDGQLPLRLGRLNGPLPTTSHLLARLEAFLPSLKASNEALLDQAARDPTSVDIEHLTPGDEGVEPEHIEMNLGLGVFALKKSAPAADASAGDDSDGEDGEDSDDEDLAEERSETDASSEDESGSLSRDITRRTEDSADEVAASPHQGNRSSNDGNVDGDTVVRPVRRRPPAA